MGGWFSTAVPSNQPWRKIDWGKKQDLLSFMKEFRPSKDKVNHVRILLYGAVGAGKSSFINSVTTVLLGRSAIPAQVNANTDSVKSFTLKYKTYKTENGSEYYPFVFNDTMGLEGQEGVQTEDIKLAMMGHVRDGYTFKPDSALSENNTQFYNPCPSADDKVHLLVCVLNASSAEIDDPLTKKIQEIREAARDLDIPQVAIATHIDIATKETKDVKNVFKSDYLERKMNELSSTVGIPGHCMYPVWNYSSGSVDNNEDMDTLILTALKYMLHHADDFLKK